MNQKANFYFARQEDGTIYDVYDLFQYYNSYFFNHELDACTVRWTKRMTLCAGTCKDQGFGSSTISLSEPLLKFRSSNQLKQTLIHEMIHAYLFKTNRVACQTQGGHGPAFKQIMYQINSITKLNITVYHTFHNEVEFYKKHIWRCGGRCKDQPPYFGYVKRSMNRAPQPADFWFNEHKRTCGGNFTKLSGPQKIEPQKNNKKGLKMRKSKKISQEKDHKSWGCGKSIQDYFKQIEKQSKSKDIKQKQKNQQKNSQKSNNFTNIQNYSFKQQNKVNSIAIFKKKGKTLQQYAKQIQMQKEKEKFLKQTNEIQQQKDQIHQNLKNLLQKYQK